jgi:hypothetical protein
MPPAQQTETEKQAAQKKKESERLTFALITELLFVILPFIVIGITLANRGELRTLFFIPEWSIVAAVIIGQAIVRFASVAIGRPVAGKEAIVFMMTLMLVAILVPTLLILVFVLTSPITLNLAIAQGGLFAFSLIGFILATGVEISIKMDDEQEAERNNTR